ncbi:MAG: restriction endonuclease [Thermoprotei archaeon]
MSWSQLEEKIAQYFSLLGYNVTRNLRIKGKSGALHEIDVYAEKEGPEGKIRIIIEAKDYSEPVTKEWVMKLAEVKEDIGADKAILITSSRFTPSAIAIAQNKGVDLWDHEILAEKLKMMKINEKEVNVKILSVSLTKDEALKIVFKNLRRILFFKSERIKDFSLVFHPTYLFEIRTVEFVSSFVGKPTKRYIKRYLMIDSVNGNVLGFYKISGRSYINVNDPLMRVLAILSSKGEILLNDAEKMISKELIKDMINQHIFSYDAKKNILRLDQRKSHILVNPNIIEKKLVTLYEKELFIEKSVTSIDSLFDKLSGEFAFDVLTMATIFYPFYKAVVVDKSGGERYIYVDGVIKHTWSEP